MARLTVTEAIKRSPVGKSQFYAKYLDGGLITVSVDERDKKYIDSSELLRCFGSLDSGKSEQTPVDSKPNVSGVSNAEQSEVVGLLKEQLKKSEEREEHYRKHIDALTLRLEAPVPAETNTNELEQKIANLTEQLKAPTPIKRQSKLSKWWQSLGE